ncbi:hypothetical protein tinsulaeT_04810 [Thalassotalea insulae]|uniref:Permease n=1 Tax=Thalassotalea insulae TaxID=2056778 RepID=A0ABQ6GMP3_9GAMM|nr:permease [Thalassotalea insulae]GLX77141.1 hypothetical protein tinsulaeT_04810 [Thalassotalea insulae]
MNESIESTLNMFVFLALELTTLFLVISYLVGVIQYYIPPSKIEALLSSKKGKGHIIAAFLGAITPFCSCSTIPFLKGLLRARAGFGPMLVFLFASPLLNPIVLGLFTVTFGWQVALFYFSVAIIVSVSAGVILEKLGFEQYVKEEDYIETPSSGCASKCSTKERPVSKWLKIWQSTWKDFKAVLPYLAISITVGAVIHGFVPAEFIASVANKDNLLAIPIAAVIGIPLYIRAAAMIPLSSVLVSMGMGLGAVMALIIGSAGASLTEVILLKSLFKNQMIIAFLVVVLSMAVGAGTLYSLLF